MPRVVNPGTILTGPGKTVPGLGDDLVLIGAGVGGGHRCSWIHPTWR